MVDGLPSQPVLLSSGPIWRATWGMSVKNGLCIAVWSGLFLLVAACGDTESPNAGSSPDPDVIAGLVRVSDNICMKELEATDSSEKLDFAEVLGVHGMTFADFCNCTSRTLLESLSQGDLDQFMRDAGRYKNIGEHEPWKTRNEHAVLRCLTGNWPG